MLEILKKYPSTHFLLNFTETDFTNQMLQTIYETEVRHAIEHGKHVIFQATPIFRNVIMKQLLAELIFKRFQQMERLILMFICLMLSLE